MATLCAACLQTFPSPKGVWAGMHKASPSKLILTVGSKGSLYQCPTLYR